MDKKEDEAPKGGKKKMIIIIVAALIVLAAGGGGAYFFMFAGHGDEKDQGSTLAVIDLPEPPVLHEMGQIIVDLKTDKCTSPFIKLKPMIEISASYIPQFKEKEAKIIDALQVFLRSLTRSEVVGKEGVDRLRGGFAEVIDRELAPAKIRAVMFKEFILQ
ncbi:MAG: hypothetical protein A3G18_05240 [Rhodospirillales bacterium RIFCSPLOWO2_12_FULL_58_28]|nr:MAG: hypothetical protein A3H92_05335 [Rhodospirillales bacterium RIFCSPLOWO2_02_FULL_58_16]OHC78312.1 MAG: hypothetical protein A3G18_05240 [Rhodospirillales bacterium RIFCSPLOWO2_12_FULL_58_28]